MDKKAGKRNVPGVCAVVLSGFLCGSVYAGEWEKPWDSVKGAAAQRCAKTFEALQMQAVCMDNEKKGYDRMKGDFGMPGDVATKAKARCEKTFEPFQMQAVCMDNEKKGFDRMKGDFGMPSDVAKKAKARCEKTFEPFQLQAVCMDNEKDGYDRMKNY